MRKKSKLRKYFTFNYFWSQSFAKKAQHSERKETRAFWRKNVETKETFPFFILSWSPSSAKFSKNSRNQTILLQRKLRTAYSIHIASIVLFFCEKAKNLSNFKEGHDNKFLLSFSLKNSVKQNMLLSA